MKRTSELGTNGFKVDLKGMPSNTPYIRRSVQPYGAGQLDFRDNPEFSIALKAKLNDEWSALKERLGITEFMSGNVKLSLSDAISLAFRSNVRHHARLRGRCAWEMPQTLVEWCFYQNWLSLAFESKPAENEAFKDKTPKIFPDFTIYPNQRDDAAAAIVHAIRDEATRMLRETSYDQIVR